MNPFTLKYNSDFFCDRENEIQYLKDNITNGRDTLIHSPRRLGKSALIHHLFHLLEKEDTYETLFIDLFATNNLEGLIKSLGESILNKYHKKNLLTGIKKLFKGLHASLSLSADGSPQLGLSITESQINPGLDQLLQYLENRKKIVIVALDEFQQVATYPENAEAILRTIIQQLNNVYFIYSGSSNHILQNMFYSAKQPFYQSSESLVLDKIDSDKYTKFINWCFESNNKTITIEAINHFLDFTQSYTYYTQVICNQAFYKCDSTMNFDQAVQITNNYIETRKLDYLNIYNLLSENQKKVIAAIAKEGIVSKPSSVKFMIKHKLPSSSSTLQALGALDTKELIYKTIKGYRVYDVFFNRFLERYF